MIDINYYRGRVDAPWVQEWDKAHEASHFKLLGRRSFEDADQTLASIWLVEDRLYSDADKRVIGAHEFGHALGLSHIKDKRSVMSEFYNGATACLSQDDMVEFCNKFRCNAVSMIITLRATCGDT